MTYKINTALSMRLNHIPLLLGLVLFAVNPSDCFVVSSRLPRATIVATRVAATTIQPEAPARAVGKLTPEAKELEDVLRKKSDDHKLLVAQTAPSVRISFPEMYGKEPGSFDTGQLVASLKELGFDIVLDTNTAADLTICEEGTELLHRIMARQNLKEEGRGDHDAEPLPLFTSCCPGWMSMVAKSAPELIPYISTCKSPHMMYGAVVKRNSEELFGRLATEIYTCSVMPCVKKRGESDHSIFTNNSVRDVDNVITTKDLGALLAKYDVDPRELDPIPFDSPFQKEEASDEDDDGLGSGAGQLFGATGGVMEASVRSVYELITGSKLPRLELEEVRGFDGLKETTVPLHSEEAGKGLDVELRVAVINGLGQAKKLIQQMKDGEIKYDFVEVMACPGGCIGGGGQPKSDKDVLAKRMEVLYKLDKSLPIRRSHENPTVKKLYENLLGGEFGSEEAKQILHVKPVYGDDGGVGE